MNIFDSEFNGQHSERYRALVFPELFPHEKKDMLLDNWPLEDKIDYCGGEYLKGVA